MSIGEEGKYQFDNADPNIGGKLVTMALEELEKDPNEFIVGAISALQMQTMALRGYCEYLQEFLVVLTSKLKFPISPFTFEVWSDTHGMTQEQQQEYFKQKQIDAASAGGEPKKIITLQ